MTYLLPNLVNDEQPTKDSALEVLTKIARSQDGSHWVYQQKMLITTRTDLHTKCSTQPAGSTRDYGT
ncbi:hypothetical protein ACFLTP_02975 [Chloroflexota bacterium]